MASLKDINASIEEGNENTEKLNANFSRWLKSQKTSGDDLEAARERKRTVAVKGGDTFISNKITKGGGSSGILKNLLTKAMLAATVAAAVAAALKLLKDKGKDFLGDDSIVDGTKNSTVLGTGALVAGSLYGGFKGVQYGNRMGKALANAMEAGQAKKIAAQNQKINNGTIRNNKIKISLVADELDDLKRQQKINQAAKKLRIKLLSLANADALGNTGREVRTNTPKSRFSGFSNLNNTGGKVTAFDKMLNNARNSSTRIPTAANTNRPAFGKNTKATTSSKFKNFLKSTSANVKPMVKGGFNSIKQGMSSVTNTGSKIAKGVMPTLQNFGNNSKAYIKALAAWAQTMNPGATAKKVGMLLLKILGGAFRFVLPALLPVSLGLSIGSWASVMFGKGSTQNEKIAATGEFIGGWTGFAIGASIGAAIANVPGAIIGGIFGAMSGAELASALFLWGASKTRTMQADIEKKKALLMGAGLFQTDPAFARIGGLNSQGQNMFQAFGSGGMNANILQRDDFGGKPFIPTTAGGLIPKMQTNADMIPGYTAMAASKTKAKKYGSFLNKDLFLGGADVLNKGNKTPDFVRGISGGGSSGTLTFPEVGNGLSSLSNQKGAGMIRRGSEASSVNAAVNSGNTTSSVTTVLSGGNGLNTIDTYVLQPGFNISHSMYTGSSRGQYN